MYATHFHCGYAGALELLVKAKADVNRQSLHGDTALMVAAYDGVLSDLLLKHGAEINHSNADGVTALMLLSQWWDFDKLQEAISFDADVKAKDKAARTVLDYFRAAACGRPVIALPEEYMQARRAAGPSPCPPQGSEYLRIERLLTPDIPDSKRP